MRIMQGADEKDPKVLPRHQVLDCVVQNKQGEDLMNFLGNTGTYESCEWERWQRWLHWCVWKRVISS